MRYTVVNIVQFRLSVGRQRIPTLRFNFAVGGGVQYRWQSRHLRAASRLLVGCVELDFQILEDSEPADSSPKVGRHSAWRLKSSPSIGNTPSHSITEVDRASEVKLFHDSSFLRTPTPPPSEFKEHRKVVFRTWRTIYNSW